MNIKKLLIATIAVIGITACSPDSVDHNISTALCFCNESSHRIVLTVDNPIRTSNESLEIVLNPTSEYNSTKFGLREIAKGCSAIFDDKVQIDYSTVSMDSKHNLMVQFNYEDTSDEQYHICYTYTFTDADYQFALENGTMLE